MQRYLVYTCFAMLLALHVAKAQTPTYQYTWYPAITTSGGGTGGSQEFRNQGLYTNANFPGMPAGRVKAIYVRVAYSNSIFNPGSTLCRVAGVTAKIGYTRDTTYKMGNDTFRTGLTTIYGPDTFSIPCTFAKGLWIRIPVTKGNFYYNPEGAKFAVEVSCGPQTNPDMQLPILMTSIGGQGCWKVNTAFKLSDKLGGTGGNAMDLGFDLGQPADVEALSNITSFGLFPNPVTDGRFNMSIEAAQPVKEITITITNAVGQLIHRQQYQQAGKTLFKEVRMGAVAPGIYFAEVLADGERIVRRLLVE